MAETLSRYETYFSQLTSGNRLLDLDSRDRSLVAGALEQMLRPISRDPNYEKVITDAHTIADAAGELSEKITVFLATEDSIFSEPLETFSGIPSALLAFSGFLKNLAVIIAKPGLHAQREPLPLIIIASAVIRKRLGSFCDEDLAELAQLIPSTRQAGELSAAAIEKRRYRFKKDYPELYAFLLDEVVRPM